MPATSHASARSEYPGSPVVRELDLDEHVLHLAQRRLDARAVVLVRARCGGGLLGALCRTARLRSGTRASTHRLRCAKKCAKGYKANMFVIAFGVWALPAMPHAARLKSVSLDSSKRTELHHKRRRMRLHAVGIQLWRKRCDCDRTAMKPRYSCGNTAAQLQSDYDEAAIKPRARVVACSPTRSSCSRTALSCDSTAAACAARACASSARASRSRGASASCTSAVACSAFHTPRQQRRGYKGKTAMHARNIPYVGSAWVMLTPPCAACTTSQSEERSCAPTLPAPVAPLAYLVRVMRPSHEGQLAAIWEKSAASEMPGARRSSCCWHAASIVEKQFCANTLTNCVQLKRRKTADTGKTKLGAIACKKPEEAERHGRLPVGIRVINSL
eukprot:6205735-Pleurochrysis_carterae.AAC.2